MTIQHVLQTTDDMTQLFDRFVVSGCRLRLMGTAVTVDCDPADQDRAHALVGNYVEALRQEGFFIPRVLSLEEFASLPPGSSSTMPGPRASLRNLERSRERIGRARRAIVEPAHPRLSQCYDYFQQALHEPKHTMYYLYKLVETVEDHFGGERNAIRALDARALIKSLKNDANRLEHDQRHAPSEPGNRQPLDENALAALAESARELLNRFEAAMARPSEPTHEPEYEANIQMQPTRRLTLVGARLIWRR